MTATQPAPSLQEPRVLKSLTMASIRCNPAACKTVNDPVLLCALLGQVTGTREVKDPTDPGQFYTAITGSFEAINAQNGEVYKSGTLYLPSSFQATLIEQITEVLKVTRGTDADGNLKEAPRGDTSSIEIAYEIYSVKDGCPAGYTYQMRELKPAGINDPLAALRRDVAAAGRSKLVTMEGTAEIAAGAAPAQIAAPAMANAGSAAPHQEQRRKR